LKNGCATQVFPRRSELVWDRYGTSKKKGTKRQRTRYGAKSSSVRRRTKNKSLPKRLLQNNGGRRIISARRAVT
jgi:hypothetical protein